VKTIAVALASTFFCLPAQAQTKQQAQPSEWLVDPGGYSLRNVTQSRIVSRLTTTPRDANRSSTSAVLNAKRWYAQTG